MDEVILSRIRQEAYEQGYQDGKVDGYNLAWTQMSSAKQERKKGKWIWQGSISEGCWVCSECKHKFYQGYGNENFCQNCGSDMREEGGAK